MATISGVITAMATPFDDGERVDVDAGRRLARHLIENGSHGLVVNGTTGESPTTDDAEKLELLAAVKDEVGAEATIIAGAGSNDTAHSVELATASTEAGADALLAVTPYYNKPNEAGLRGHYEAIAAVTDLPLILYNIPSRSVVNMEPAFMAELAASVDNIVAVKQANSDQLQPIPGLDLLAGNDDVFLRCLEMGGTGGILVASHVVGLQMRAVYEAVASGDASRAQEIDEPLHVVYDAMGVTTNPIPVKEALALLGIASARMRLPLVGADDAQRASIRAALESVGALAASAG
ncbi:MAG: 4-hydroxy-tetrahydrodipicolinate synthase [Solirubrobacterales bacterium]